MVSVIASFDCSVPLLFKPLTSVRPTVLPNTVPDCVPKVTFVPFTLNALPACSTAAAPVLLMATADVPALTARLLVASTLPVLVNPVVRFSVASPLDCSVPLLVMVLAVMMPLMPARSDAVSVPELVKVAELLVKPFLASSVPLLVTAPPTASVIVSFDCSVPLLFRLATVSPTVLPSTVPCWVSKVALEPVTVSALPACSTAAAPVLLTATAEVPALTTRLLMASTLPVLASAVVKFSVALPLDWSVPLLARVLVLNVPLAAALSDAVKVPLLSTVSEVLVKPFLASSVPELVNAPPMVSVIASFDCSVPLLFKLATVSPTVLPSTVPDCVPNVALAPFTVSALPACNTAAAPVLLMATADVPALTARLLAASTLPVLVRALVRFKSRLPADCSVPLLVNVARVNAPA